MHVTEEEILEVLQTYPEDQRATIRKAFGITVTNSTGLLELSDNDVACVLAASINHQPRKNTINALIVTALEAQVVNIEKATKFSQRAITAQNN